MRDVLLIEGDVDIRNDILGSIMTGFKPGGLRIISSGSYDAAMEAIRDYTDFEIIILDGELGGDDPDGILIIPAIKERFPSTPVIAISGSKDTREAMIKCGCTHECDKRFVAATVLQLLESRKSAT